MRLSHRMWFVAVCLLLVLTTVSCTRADEAFENGMRWMSEGRTEDAQVAIQFATSLDPSLGSAFVHYGEAVEHYGVGEYAEAIDKLTLAIEEHADFPDAYVARGHAYSAIEMHQQAIDDYTRAIALDSSMPSAVYVSRGNEYLALSQWEKAIADYDVVIASEILQASASDALIMAYKAKGAAHAHLGDYVQMRSAFEEVLRLRPGDADAEQLRRIMQDLAP